MAPSPGMVLRERGTGNGERPRWPHLWMSVDDVPRSRLSWPEPLTQETPHKIEGLIHSAPVPSKRENGEIGDYSTPGLHSLAACSDP